MNSNKYANKLPYVGYFSVFIIYLLLRIVAWKKTFLFEDHDSVAYLLYIKTYMQFNLNSIINLSPDHTPFYAIFGALFSLPGWPVEFGARICSLSFSILLFICMIIIAKRIGKPYEIIIGLILLSFNPVLIPLSFAILTQPSYIATCYLGLAVFLVQFKKPNLWYGAILGTIFALCFLNRTEGLFYLLIIPFIQVCHFFMCKQPEYNLKKLVGWTCIFVIFFSIFAIPQIVRVSYKMGRFAINGRQTWALIINMQEGKSYDEKIYGLNYDTLIPNLWYLQSHQDKDMDYESEFKVNALIKRITKNYSELCLGKTGKMLGTLGILFFALGLFAIYQSNFTFECFVIVAFIVSSLVASIIAKPAMRYIAIVAPIMTIVAGFGIGFTAQLISNTRLKSKRSIKLFVVLLCVCAMFVAFTVPLNHIYARQREYNWEYNSNIIRDVADIVNKIAKDEQINKIKIISRKSYLPYFANAKKVAMPYTDYMTLVSYSSEHEIDFLFLQHRLIKKYPFLVEFSDSTPPAEFELIYKTIDDYGEKIELYRFK